MRISILTSLEGKMIRLSREITENEINQAVKEILKIEAWDRKLSREGKKESIERKIKNVIDTILKEGRD